MIADRARISAKVLLKALLALLFLLAVSACGGSDFLDETNLPSDEEESSNEDESENEDDESEDEDDSSEDEEESSSDEEETTDGGCDASVDASLIGTVGTSGDCAGLLIVDNTMIKAAASAEVGGDESLDFKPGDSYTTHSGSTYDFTEIYTGNVTDMSSLFSEIDSFNQDIGGWDVSNVTDMSRMFLATEENTRAPAWGNGIFNQDISGWDTSKVRTMAGMFWGQERFQQDINGWDVSNVTDMSDMFLNSDFNEPIGDWMVANVTNMSRMFYGSEFNQDISSWTVSNVEDMSEMFDTTMNFNQNIGSWDVSNVKNMYRMFATTDKFHGDIGSWDVSNVTDMSEMFYLTNRFNQDIGAWDVSSVTDMNYMFYNAAAFNQDLNFNPETGAWNVSNVTDMNLMFAFAEVFDGNLGSWDVSNVTNMNYMFGGADAFNQDISSWDVSKVTNMEKMLYSADAFNQDLSAWNVCNVDDYDDFATDSPIESDTAKHPDWGMTCPASITANAITTQTETQSLPAEPSVAASSLNQSLQAATLSSLLNQHARPQASAGTALGSQPPSILSARSDGDLSQPLDWVALGYRQVDSTEAIAGTGSFAYALVGDRLGQGESQSFGYALGLEQGDWDYDNESDVTKTGLSAGLYGGASLEDGDLVGSALLTRFRNDHRNADGEDATSSSHRLLVSGTFSRAQDMDAGATLTPFAEALYAYERLGSYSYDGLTTYEGTSADVGEISLGTQYRRTLGPSGGTLIVSGEIERSFGTGTITLSDGETYSPNTTPTGEVSVGWTSGLASETVISVSLTIGELGNNDREEIKLAGTWDRAF